MKHKKQLFMILLVIFLLVGLTALAATDATQKDTKSVKKSIDAANNTPNKDTDTATKVSAQNDKDNTKIVETKKNKTIKKINSTKNVKSSSYTKNVKNYGELVNAVNDAKTRTTDEYIINLSGGTYTATANMTWNSTGNCRTLVINGNNTTLNGNNKYYFMRISKDNTLILNDITIINFRKIGNAGAILNEGTLTITNSTFKNNEAAGLGGGAIYNYKSTLTVKNSKFTSNIASYGGGAIYNYESNINITNTTFTDNKIEYSYDNYGGAIHNNGNMSIVNSSFLRNNGKYAGAIYNRGILNVNNTNFTNNHANIGGGAIHNTNNLSINKVTLKNNRAEMYGGAIYSSNGTLTINNTTLNNNHALEGGAIYNTNPRIINIYNSTLENNNASWGGAIYNNDTGNLSIYNSTLENNSIKDYEGGAINNRGYMSIHNSTLENNRANGTVVHGGAIMNEYGSLSITNSKLNNNTAIGTGGAIHNNQNANLNITNTILNNNTAIAPNHKYGLGGAIMNNGFLNVNNTNFTNNKASAGGSLVINGTTSINNTKFTNNTVTLNGGAIFNENNLKITNTNFTENIAPTGGAIINHANISISNTKFLNNKATGDKEHGGAIYNYDGAIMNITSSHLEHNNAHKGGAIHNYEAYIHISHTNFTNNTAKYAGAINNEGNMSIRKSNFTYNKADYAGAINTTGNLNITETTLDNNDVGVGGGALYNVGGNLTVKHCQINNHDAINHAGAVRSDGGSLEITNTTLNNNTSNYGGAINTIRTTLKVHNCTLNNNKARSGGGAIWTNNYINITKNVFTYNTANKGSAIYNMGHGTITNNTFKTNKASTTGKAIKNDGTAEIKDNINDETSIYSATIYTNSTDVKILKNIFDDGILNTTITISTNNNKPKVNDKINITFILRDQADRTIPDQIINITINDEKYNRTTNQDGTAQIEYIPTSNQKLTITATYSGNEKYNNTTTEAEITVDKITTILTATLNNGTPSQASTNITLIDEKGSPMMGAPIIVTDKNGKLVNQGTTDSNGKTNIQLHLPEGTHNVTITYPGNGTHNRANITQPITITKHTPTINVTDDKNGTIKINVTDEDNNPLPGLPIQVIDENNALLGESTTDNNGNASIKIILEPGKYDITIKTTGDEDTKDANITIPLIIPPKDTKMDVKAINGTQVSVEVKLTDEKGNPIKGAQITAKDKDQKQVGNGTTDSSGKANIPLNIPAGTQSVTITYPGNTTYKQASNTTTITKDKHQPTIEATADSKGTIKIKITDETGTPIPGIPVKITDETGKQIANGSTGQDGNITLQTNLEPGKHNITITTPEDKDNKASNKTIPVTIPPKDSKIDITVTDPIKGNTTIKVYLKNNTENPISNAPITVTLPNSTKIVAKTGPDGTVEILLNLPLGNNQIKVDYAGNETYKPTSKNMTINVQKIPTTTTITVQNNTAGNVRVTGTVKDKYGQNVAEGTVTIKEGNNNIGRGPVNNGTYTITTTIGSKGTYKLTAQYTETNNYLPSNSQTTTDIIAQTPDMTTRIEGNKVGNISITVTLKDQQGKAINNAPVTVTLTNGSKTTGTTNNNGTANIPLDLREGSNTITTTYTGNGTYNPISTKNTANVTKDMPIIKLDPVRGIIGEKITLTAYITDESGKAITGGNLAFKLNGKTLRSDGRFDSSAPAMKFKVENGKVTYTLNADLYLRNAKNLTASYSGTSKYKETNSESVEAQIQKRYANLTVTVTPNKVKQYNNITIKVTAKDTTKNGKNNTLIHDNTKVMLKINGVTLKDAKGKTLYIPIQQDNTATYTYNIPGDMGGVTSTGKARNYQVTAVFMGDNYYPGAKNVTTFQVERSNTTVTIQEAKVVTKTNILSVKATLTDYKGNYLRGTNKVTIKINGKNYVDSKTGKAKYWSVKDGKVNLKDIQVDPKTTIKRVMLVTGERQAYTEGRAETTKIIRV